MFANAFGIPTAPTVLFIVGLVVVIAYLLWRDRAPYIALEHQVGTLRDDVAALNEKLSKVEALYDEQRTLKHSAVNELTKAQVLLGIILDLAEKCTCGALDIVGDLLSRTVPEPPHAHRRADDL
jgi:hypothetical protein